MFRIFLAASLALNLAYIGTGIYRTVKKENTRDLRNSSVSSPYSLRDEQKEKLDTIVESFRRKLVDNKSEVLDKRIDIIELLGDPEFKTENLEEKLLELNDIENELNYEFILTVLEIGKVMDHDQWLKFLYNLSRRWFFSGTVRAE